MHKHCVSVWTGLHSFYKSSSGEKLKDFDVTVGGGSLAEAKLNKNMKSCAYYGGSFPSVGEILCTSPVQGRFLKIQLRGKNYLHLCEVEVFETHGKLGFLKSHLL